MTKFVACTILALAAIGCSEPAPLDMDEVAAEAGLSPNDYEIHDDGTMQIYSKVEALHSVDDVVAAFKGVGLPVGDFIVQTAATDPNQKLGRPDEYIGSAQFEDTRIEQPEPMSELEFNEPDLPVGGVIEIFENEEDLQSRKKHIEQVYEMMPMAKQYMYAHKLGLLRLEYALTPEQAKEYETVFMSL